MRHRAGNYTSTRRYLVDRFRIILVCTLLIATLSPHSTASAVQITLGWGRPADGSVVNGYRVYSRLERQSYNYSQPRWQGTTTTSTIADLQAVTTYFVARAYNSYGESADSNEVVYRPATTSPAISRNPTSLSPSCVKGANASRQTFQVWNSGGGTLSYSISDNAGWLSCSPTSGSSTGEQDTVTVSYATSALAAGTHTATITIAATGASNTPRTIPVTLTVKAAAAKGVSNTPETIPVSLTVGETLPIQVGQVSGNQSWKKITFARSFDDPVIVATILTTEDPAPAVVRIRNLTRTGCEIRLEEWNYLDGVHGEETIGYLVMERGRYTLADGTQVEAGRFMTNKTTSYAGMAFSQPFRKVPVMAAAVSTVNEADTVTGRLRKISTRGFEFRMQEQELNSQKHVSETICYVAWEPSSGAVNGTLFEVGRTQNTVTDAYQTIEFFQDYSEPPVVIADMQTTDGGDTANVRYRNWDLDGIDVQVDEEASRDSESAHTTEVVGYMAFGTAEVQ